MKKLVALAFMVVAIPAMGQGYPAKPIRIVVPYTAGGPVDLLVRGMGQRLGEVFGQQIVVENKPGAAPRRT